jgi:hypothetical protein
VLLDGRVSASCGVADLAHPCAGFADLGHRRFNALPGSGHLLQIRGGCFYAGAVDFNAE